MPYNIYMFFKQSNYMYFSSYFFPHATWCLTLWSLSQDDMIDEVEDFVATAEILKARGAYKIYVMATHGLLSADAPRLIEESAIDEVKSCVNDRNTYLVTDVNIQEMLKNVSHVFLIFQSRPITFVS